MRKIINEELKRYLLAHKGIIGLLDNDYFEIPRMMRPSDIGVSWRLNRWIYQDSENNFVSRGLRSKYVYLIWGAIFFAIVSMLIFAAALIGVVLGA